MSRSEQTLDLELRLLDHQVVGPDGDLLCKVDDIEFEQGGDGSWHVSALLSGPQGLGPRLPGRLGRWVQAVGRRLSVNGNTEPHRIPFECVTEISSSIVVDRARDRLDIAPLEKWVREHIIDPIPGSRHASE